LYVNASRQLADLLEVAGHTDDAKHWQAEADRAAAGVRLVFWDGSIGLFRAATIQCKEPDIWGSAYAAYLGVASEEQTLAIARYFQKHYGEIAYRGQIRHLPGGVYWEVGCARDEYQNGAFWATPTGWFVDTLDRVDPALADRTVAELVSALQENECAEWVFGEKKGVLRYTANVALPIAGITKMLARRQNATGRSQ
jgi:glycogen debranching enzyme